MPYTDESQAESRRAVPLFQLAPWVGLAVILLSIQTRGAQAQFQELVSRIPSGANAVVLFNVEKALERFLE